MAYFFLDKNFQRVILEKNDGIERLVWGACGNLLIRGEVRNSYGNRLKIPARFRTAFYSYRYG